MKKRNVVKQEHHKRFFSPLNFILTALKNICWFESDDLISHMLIKLIQIYRLLTVDEEKLQEVQDD